MTPAQAERLAAIVGEEETLDSYSERILDAAREQLIEHGLRRTSLDDIARAAEVGRATLFRRFPTRQALIGALAIREARRLIATVDAEAAPIEDPRERSVAGFLAFTRAIGRERLLQRLLVTDPELVLPLLTVRGSQTLDLGRAYLAAQVRRAQADGAHVAGDPEQIAEILARLALSLALNPETVLPLGDERRLERFARNTILPLIFGSARA